MEEPDVASSALRARFEAVYRQNAWGDDESASGSGSRLDSACVADTEHALAFAIRELGVGSIVDAPCGDFNWMRRFIERHPGVAYRGFDIVADIVARNAERYPGRRFDLADLTRARPPKADLILCKDLVNHLSDEHVCQVLHNFKASGSTYLLLSNNRGAENVELAFDVGGFSRHLDVTRPPFGLPPPFWETHYLGLWRADQVPDEFVLPAAEIPIPVPPGRVPADFVMGGAALVDDMPPLLLRCGAGASGIVLFGPYMPVKAGRYRASFRLQPLAPPPARAKGPAARAEGSPVARVEVTAADGATVVGEATVSPARLRSDPRVVLDFELAREEVLEFRVHAFGALDMLVDYDRRLVRAERRFSRR